MLRMRPEFFVSFLMAVVSPAFFSAYGQQLPVGDAAPVLRLETDGPRSFVSGLAFAPNGDRLYAVGWDKAVLAWDFVGNPGRFEFNAKATLRTPVGVGDESSMDGALNAIALSPDGIWLATAGVGPIRDSAGVREAGYVTEIDDLPLEKKLDKGLIYVFNTATRQARILRGHSGDVCSLAFVRGSKSSPPELVSAAEEWSDGNPRVRLWDVKNGKELSVLDKVPRLSSEVKDNSWVPLPKIRRSTLPGITAWSTGDDAIQAQVAIGWGDNQFRIWDTKTGRVASSISAANSMTVLPLTSRGEQIVAGGNAEIGLWAIPPMKNGMLPEITYKDHFQKSQIPSVSGKKDDGIPAAAVLIPKRNGKAPLIAFVVVRYLPENNGQYRGQYRLLVTTASSPMQTVNEFDLNWGGGVRTPRLAITADGQKLAIAGSEQKEIAIYQTDDLLIKGRIPSPQQRLGSLGMSFDNVAFVRDGDQWGLQLSESRPDSVNKTEAKPLVFDITERRVEPIGDKWRLANSKTENWSVTDGTKTGNVVVRRQDKPEMELKLTEGFSLTDIAFCPPSKFWQAPLIAVASQMNGRPSLGLYDGDTGKLLRSYASHTERIRSVKFSEDGRMLASVADDRPICVWTTTDLVERLGKHGMILGVNFQLNRKPLVIVKRAPASHTLKSEDEIVAAVHQGEEIKFNSVKEYYQYVRERKPGEIVEFKIRREGKIRIVRCDIGQEVDSARPLFTLFIARAQKQAEFEWVGWTPLGPFDLRGDRVDQWLGWHFNTGQAEKPADFAVIGQYRDLYLRRDLLKQLIETQKSPVVQPAVPDEPKVSYFLRHLDGALVPTDYEDIPQLDVSQVEIVAEVTGVSSRKIRGLQLSIDEKKAEPFQKNEDDSNWVAKISNVNWKRGPNLLTLVLQTKDREVTSVGRVEYHPPAPVITWEPDKKWRRDFPEQNVTVEARVTPSSEPIHVELLRQRPGNLNPELIEKWETRMPLAIKVSVPVFEGENQIEIVARNATAPREHQELEVARFPAFVRVAKPPMAPEIVLKEVRVLPADGDSRILIVDPESPDTYRSLCPDVEILGLVTGTHDLGRAELSFDGNPRVLAGFQADKVRQFPFREAIALKPGSQSVIVQAAVRGVENEKRIVLIYERPVPKIARLIASVTAIKPLPENIRFQDNVFYAGYNQQTATVSADLDGQLGDDDRVVLRMNQVAINPDDIKIDRDHFPHNVTARIPLAGGKNSVSMRVENDWSRQPASRELTLEFRRPPVVTDIQAARVLVEMPLDLTCRIQSALPIRSTKIIVDGQNEIAGTLSEVKGSPGEYMLAANNVGLSTGNHVVEITASNDEGALMTPIRHELTVQQKVKPPILEIVSPVTPNFQSPSKRIEIQYTVNSAEPATIRLKICGNDNGEIVPIDKPIDAKQVPIDGKTIAAIPLDLFEGQNDIEIEASNSGGFSAKRTLTVAYTPHPATVEIVTLDKHPVRWRDGKGFIEDSVQKARVQLQGRVQFKEDLKADRKLKAKIWVNGFVQIAVVEVDSTDLRTGTFSADLTMSRPKDNEVKIEVFDEGGQKPSTVDASKQLIVNCQNPERGQDLYLVLLGTGDLDVLRESAKTALKATPTDEKDPQNPEEKWTSKLFSSIRVFDAMKRTPANVSGRLMRVKQSMERNRMRFKSSGSQAIVMVYFQGKIELTDKDFRFITREDLKASQGAFTGRDMQKILNETFGAHLVFLDLKQNDNNLTELDIWPKAPQLGIVVSNWKGQARQPIETQLISALENALPQIRIVSQLADSIDQQYGMSKIRFPGMIEASVRLLNEVQGVRIGID